MIMIHTIVRVQWVHGLCPVHFDLCVTQLNNSSIYCLLPLQNVGMNLRDLLSKVDAVIQELPAQTHTEVN